MELIRINDNKLKIMLTSHDMKNYALDAQTLSCGTEETRRAFRSILHDAGVGGSFEEGKDKIYVQYYPSREGGCEMFVTKLALVGSDAAKDSTGGTQLQPSLLSNAKGKEAVPSPLAYRFSSLPLLLHACRHLLPVIAAVHKRVSSCAYRDDSGSFYLTVETAPPPTGEDNAQITLALLLGEFGTPCPTKDLQAYIAEHATPLCRATAVEILGDL